MDRSEKKGYNIIQHCWIQHPPGGWGALDPCLGEGVPLRVKSRKISTLLLTKPSTLGPCLGQMTKYTLSCFTQF